MSAKSFLWLFLAVSQLHGQSLINVDFGVGSRSPKIGFAGTGQSTNDFWNLYRHYDPKFAPGMPLVFDGALANLKYADGTDSKIALMVTNAPGVWGNATGDPMYDSYIFAQNGSNITVAVHHLEPARYHFYLYGHADADVTGEQNSVFTLRTGTNSFGPATARRDTSPYQFVVFRDVEVSAGAPVLIEVAAGPNGIPVLNGMQIISRGTSPPRIIPPVAAVAPSSLTNIIFKEIRYTGKVTDTEARFAVVLDVESLATNEISGPLFEGDVAVIPPDIPEGLRIVSAAKQYRLIATRPGSFRLKFDLVAKITRAEPWNQIRFTGPPAAIGHVSASAGAGIEMNLLSGVDGFLGSDRNVALRWQSKTAEVARKSLVTVDTAASALVTPMVIKYTTQFRYEILQAPVAKLAIVLPAGHAVTRVQGEQIRDWQIEDDQLNIEFTKPAEKSYLLVLHTEQTVEDTPATLQLQVPRPLNIERESGAFNISADDMTVSVDTLTGLRQVNAPRDTVAAFRFHGRPFELSTRLQRIEPVVKVADRVSARVEETRLLLSHALALTVDKAGIYSLDLTPQPGFVVADVNGEGLDEWKVVDGILRVNFSSRVLGTRKINVQLEQAQAAFPPQFAVLPLRAAGATNETAEIGVASALGIRLKTGSELTGVREIPVTGRSDEALAFRAEQPDWRLTVGAERLPARIVAEVFNLVTIGDGLVGGSATIRYGVINQGVQEFRVRLPAHWKNVEFTGPNIRRKELLTPDVWSVTLQDKAWGGYTLVITYDYQFDPKKATLDLGGAHAVDIERESGSVAITTAASLKLEPKAVADPLRVIDQTELSDVDRGLITRPVLLAYRYNGTAFALAADVTRHQEVAVLDAVADRTQLTSVLTEEGQMVTQASFMVKNNDKQYQKFRLPAGANLWGCYVNNQPVKGEVDGDWLAVSLPRGANRDQTFGVDIVYAQKFDVMKSAAIPRSMALAAPQTDVPNTYAEWQVYVPPSRRLSGFAGNMDVARGTTYGLADAWRQFVTFYAGIAQGAVVLFGAAVLILAAAVIGMKRRGWNGFITALGILLVVGIAASMMLPAIKSRSRQFGEATALSAAQRPASSYGGIAGAAGPNQPALAAPAAEKPAVAGIRSIRIDVPRVGQPFTFTKVMNATDEPLSVKVSVMKHKWFVLWRSLLQFAAFAAGLIILWREWRRSSFRCALGLALSLGAVGSLLVALRALHVALIVLVPALLVGLLAWLLWKYWPRRAPEPELSAGPAVAAIALGLFFTFGANAGPTNAYSIVSAQYSGEAQDKVAHLHATIRLSTFVTNQVVPLFGEDVAIQQFNANGAEARLLRDGKGVSLRVGPKADVLLQFKLAVKLGAEGLKRQLAFGIPPALASKLTMAIDEADADLEFPTAVSFQVSPGSTSAATKIQAILGSGDRVEISWTPRVKRITDMAASIFVQHASLVTVGNGVVNMRSVLEYQVSQGELRQAKVVLPAGYRLLRVDGEWIRTWEVAEEGADQVLVVELLKGAAPIYRLTIETEQTGSSGAARPAIDLSVPRALNVIRETGVVGVRSREELALVIANAAGLQRVDVAEFSKAFGGDDAAGVVNAYRFLKPGFTLSAVAEPIVPQIEATVRNAFHVRFDQVDLVATVDYTIKKAGVFTLRLAVPTDFRIDSVTGGSNVLHWAQSGGAIEVTLKSRTIGPYSLAVHLSRLHKDLPPALEFLGVRPLDTQKLTGFVSVTSEAGIALKTGKFDGLIEVPASAVGEGARAGMLAFKQLEVWKLALTTETVESWVRAEIVDIVSVSETLLVGRAVIRYDIQNAPVKEFRLKVPASWRNVEIVGTNIRERDQSNDVWRVELQNKVRGSFQLAVTFEQPIDTKTNSAITLTGVEALGVERETGSIVVLTRPPLQVVEKSASDQLLKIDARELPDWAGIAPAAEVVLVYRYLRPGFQLVCDARRFEQAAVLQALIDSAVLTTVVADDGQMMTEMALKIRNNGLQHLEVELPPQMRVWSAFVAGQPVRPAQRGGRLLLPIERTGAQDVPIAVELTYVGLERFPKGKGRVALASPRLDVPLKNARWDVYLPPEYDYSKFAGTMTHAETVAPELQVYSTTEYEQQEFARKNVNESQVRASLDRAKRMLSTGNVKDANQDLKEALNNSFNDAETKRELEVLKRDLDRAQSSNLIQAQRAYTVDNFRKAGADGADQPVRQLEERAAKLVEYDEGVAERQWNALQKAQEVTVAKVQPLRVNLPTRGLRHSFTQVLQTEVNKPMTVLFRAANTQHIGWVKITMNTIAGFLVLWLFVAVAFGKRMSLSR